MSSSNSLALFNPSRLSAVHPLVLGDNGVLGTAQTFVMHDNQGNTYAQSTNIEMNTGNARETGINTTVRNTYPARYNHAVQQYNTTTDEGLPTKKQMRGGHFLMYRWVMIFFLLIAIAAGGVSSVIKPLIALNIVVCLVYIVLSIYNIVIFKRNGSLFNRRMVHDNRSTKSNEYFTIPIHTSVSQTNAFASQHADIVAGLQNVYSHLTEVDIMVYNEYYVRRYTYFPRSTIKYLIAFLIVMAAGIVLAITIQPSKTKD